MTFSLRPAEPSDLALVFGSWVDSYAKSTHAKACGHAYRAIQDAIVKRHVAASAVLVCCLADDPETIVGWACTDADAIHFVYVKHKWRHNGVAKLLLAPYLERGGVTHSHAMTLTDKGDPWVKIPQGWTYDPRTNYGLRAA